MRSLHTGRPGHLLILLPEFWSETWAMLDFVQAAPTVGKDKKNMHRLSWAVVSQTYPHTPVLFPTTDIATSMDPITL